MSAKDASRDAQFSQNGYWWWDGSEWQPWTAAPLHRFWWLGSETPDGKRARLAREAGEAQRKPAATRTVPDRPNSDGIQARPVGEIQRAAGSNWVQRGIVVALIIGAIWGAG